MKTNKPKQTALKLTGERYQPELPVFDISYEHWHRYLYATQFSAGKTVLDIACGEGYGSSLLAEKAAKVVGVDLDEGAVKHASEKYRGENLRFLQGSIAQIPIEGKNVFDLIVSFETIEHVDAATQFAFLSEVKRLLKPGGIFIISTPDKLFYSDLPGYANEFHVKEFYAQEFKTFLQSHFTNVHILGQDIFTTSYINQPLDGDAASLTEYGITYEGDFKPQEVSDRQNLYLIAICTEEKLPALPPSLLFDSANKRVEKSPNQVLYIDTGNGFNEAETLKKKLRHRNQPVVFDLTEFPVVKNLRFDPSYDPVLLKLNGVSFLAEDGVSTEAPYFFDAYPAGENLWLFDNYDPQIHIKVPFPGIFKKVVIDVEYVAASAEILPLLQNIAEERNARLIQEQKALAGSLASKEVEIGHARQQLESNWLLLNKKEEELILQTEQAAQREEQLALQKEIVIQLKNQLELHAIMVKEAEANLAEKKAEVIEFAQRFDRLSLQLINKDEQLWRLSGRLEKQAEKIKDIEAALAKSKVENQLAEEYATKLKQEIARLESHLEQNMEKLQWQEKRMIAIQNAAAEKQADLESRLQTIGQELQTSRTESAIKLNQVETRIEQVLAENGRLMETVRAKEAESGARELQILLFEADRLAIKSSLSYRLGYLLTMPFRKTHDLFINSFSHGKTLHPAQKMIVSAVSHPKTLLSEINGKNLATLFRALRQESLSDISHNFTRLLKKEKIATHITYEETQNSSFILLHCDDATLIEERLLLLHGWAISTQGISKIEIWENTRHLGDALYGLVRPDVEIAYSHIPESKFSGFSFKYTSDNFDASGIILKATNKSGHAEILEVSLSKKTDYAQLSLNNQYQVFLAKNSLSAVPPAEMKLASLEFPFQPLISVIVPIYNVADIWLDKCILSVLNQYYENWELCLYDDASSSALTIACLEKWTGKDERIKIKRGTINQNISLASNEAIKMAAGDFIGLLDNDDELTPDALFEVVNALNKDAGLDFLYSDEDKIDTNGMFLEPHFKSDFNHDMLLSQNYFCHFAVIRKSVGDRIGWFRKGYEGSQDFDLFLRVMDITRKIYHIPKVLYHWRKIQGSTASHYSEKDFPTLAGKKALEDYLKRNSISGEVLKGNWPGTYRVKRNIESIDLVSIIIPFKDQVKLLKTCVESILNKTDYKNYEILLISNNSQERQTFSFLEKMVKKHRNITWHEHNIPFNYSKINNWAARKAKGKYLLLLNNDIEVINKDWLSAMVEHIQRPEVGAVGAKLFYPDNTVQHAGVIIGLGGVAGHSHKYFNAGDAGYFARLLIPQNLSACTAACLLLKKQVFEEVGGLDEENLKIAFNDVDLCLKIRQKGYLIVYTPFAKLYHHESKSRGHEDTPEKQLRFQGEVLFFQKKWEDVLSRNDPYYNPNLTLNRENFALNIV